MPKKKKVGLPPFGLGLVLSDFFCLEAQASRCPVAGQSENAKFEGEIAIGTSFG